MNTCPRCSAEYLDHVSLCSTCHEKLIQADRSLDNNNILVAKEDLLNEPTVTISEGNLDHCRDFEKVLNKAKIPVLVYPAKLGCNDNAATLGASCAVKYLVLVRARDIESCYKALEASFYDQVAREGKGFASDAIVDVNQSEVTCPACNEHGELKNGECSFCGLFLGENKP